VSPFAFFMKQNYQAIAAKNPGLKVTQIMPLAVAEFKALADAQKAPYIKLSEADKERSVKERAAKKAERAATAKVSPYIKFSTQRRADVIAANPGIAFTDVARKLGEMWRGLSSAEKAKYSS
jgi:hypothetical protein